MEPVLFTVPDDVDLGAPVVLKSEPFGDTLNYRDVSKEDYSNHPFNQHIIIFDFNHMAHKYEHLKMDGRMPVYTYDIDDGMGGVRTIVTNVQKHVTENINRYNHGGSIPSVIVGDSKLTSRKIFFSRLFDSATSGRSDTSYKAGRSYYRDFIESMAMTQGMLQEAGASVVSYIDYEADDIIKVLVDKYTLMYPGCHIDIFTGDFDLVPLVDDNVSVYYSSGRRGVSYAQFMPNVRRGYLEIHKENYSAVLDYYSTREKDGKSGIPVPYNLLLLKKMLRGDKSDSIPAPRSKRFRPATVASILSEVPAVCESLGLSVSDVFRYGSNPHTMFSVLFKFLFPDDVMSRIQDLMAQGYQFYLHRGDSFTNYAGNGVEDSIKQVFFLDMNLNPYADVAQLLGLDLNDSKCCLYDVADVFKNFYVMDLNGYLGGLRRQLTPDLDLPLPHTYDQAKLGQLANKYYGITFHHYS